MKIKRQRSQAVNLNDKHTLGQLSLLRLRRNTGTGRSGKGEIVSSD